MLFNNATLSKNQLYKRKNHINKVPIIIKQDNIARVIFRIFMNAILLMSARYFSVIIMVGF